MNLTLQALRSELLGCGPFWVSAQINYETELRMISHHGQVRVWQKDDNEWLLGLVPGLRKAGSYVILSFNIADPDSRAKVAEAVRELHV